MSAERELEPAASPGDRLGALIARSAGGDESAIADLYDATCRHVFGLVFRILRDSAEAEEVTLDVYLQVWRQAPRYEPGRGGPMVWILMMARTRAIDRLRSRARARSRQLPLAPQAEFSDPEADPEKSSWLAQRARIVQQALAGLAREQREAIELAFFEGLTHAEIAIRLSQPLGTTKSRIRLGLNRLRETLGPGGRA